MPFRGINVDDVLFLDYEKFIVWLSSRVDDLTIQRDVDLFIARGVVFVDFFKSGEVRFRGIRAHYVFASLDEAGVLELAESARTLQHQYVPIFMTAANYKSAISGIYDPPIDKTSAESFLIQREFLVAHVISQ